MSAYSRLLDIAGQQLNMGHFVLQDAVAGASRRANATDMAQTISPLQGNGSDLWTANMSSVNGTAPGDWPALLEVGVPLLCVVLFIGTLIIIFLKPSTPVETCCCRKGYTLAAVRVPATPVLELVTSPPCAQAAKECNANVAEVGTSALDPGASVIETEAKDAAEANQDQGRPVANGHC